MKSTATVTLPLCMLTNILHDCQMRVGMNDVNFAGIFSPVLPFTSNFGIIRVLVHFQLLCSFPQTRLTWVQHGTAFPSLYCMCRGTHDTFNFDAASTASDFDALIIL